MKAYLVYASFVGLAFFSLSCKSWGKFWEPDVTRVPTDWSQQAYVKAPNAESPDSFGYAVAISGNTIAVAANGERSNQTTITNGQTASGDNSASSAGAVYVFIRSGNNWSQQAYLKAPNAEASDSFGGSVAISDDTIVVGATGEDSNQTTVTNGPTASGDNSASNSGAAYIFIRSGSNWSQQAYLKAPNTDSSDSFASSLAISGETVVVGAHFEASNQTTITNGATASANNTAFNAGAAYVFVRSGITWSQQAYLKASNAETNDFFGFSVGISSDTIAVGAYGESSNQTTITNGSTASVDNSANSAGAVYVFVRSGSNWSQQAYLKAANAATTDRFGYAVAASNETIVVGAYQEDSNQSTITNGPTASGDNSASNSGAAYVFVRSGTNWSQQAYLKAPNPDASDNFGSSVAISGETIVVGALKESSNQTTITNGATASADNSAGSAGAAYVFILEGSNWSHQSYLKAPNSDLGDNFGKSVGVSGDTTVVGAVAEGSNQITITNGSTASSDNSAPGAGAAYVFIRQ